jgi:hypothetical protein
MRLERGFGAVCEAAGVALRFFAGKRQKLGLGA